MDQFLDAYISRTEYLIIIIKLFIIINVLLYSIICLFDFQADHMQHVIHGAAGCGQTDVVEHLITKYGISPKTKQLVGFNNYLK